MIEPQKLHTLIYGKGVTIEIEIEPFSHDHRYADYTAKIMLTQGGEGGQFTRILDGFPYREYNQLGLLRLALQAMDEDAFRLVVDELPTLAEHPVIRQED